MSNSLTRRSRPRYFMRSMQSQIPDYWPMLEAYHLLREPLYRTLIADAHLSHTALILDAACGDAFYSELLAEMLGPQVRIVALDRNSNVLPAAIEINGSVRLCLSDLEAAGVRQGIFDVIWLCRTMHSAPDPLRRLASLRPLLRSGGRLIVVENDLAHSPILSWPADFEHRFRTALHQALSQRCELTGAPLERYHAACHLPAWLNQIGLRGITIRSYVAQDIAPMPPTAEAYWKMTMDYQGNLIRPFLAEDDWLIYRQAFDRDSLDYMLRRPGFTCLEPLTVASGLAP